MHLSIISTVPNIACGWVKFKCKSKFKIQILVESWLCSVFCALHRLTRHPLIPPLQKPTSRLQGLAGVDEWAEEGEEVPLIGQHDRPLGIQDPASSEGQSGKTVTFLRVPVSYSAAHCPTTLCYTVYNRGITGAAVTAKATDFSPGTSSLQVARQGPGFDSRLCQGRVWPAHAGEA